MPKYKAQNLFNQVSWLPIRRHILNKWWDPPAEQPDVASFRRHHRPSVSSVIRDCSDVNHVVPFCIGHVEMQLKKELTAEIEKMEERLCSAVADRIAQMQQRILQRLEDEDEDVS